MPKRKTDRAYAMPRKPQFQLLGDIQPEPVDAAQAVQAVREYLADQVHLVLCPSPPEGIYHVRPDDQHYFEVYESRPRGHGLRLGGTRIISVDKRTGEVRDAGTSGC
jgi:hypothetical protein